MTATPSSSNLPATPTTPSFLSQPKSYSSFSAYLATWTPESDALASFLSHHRCGHHADAFKENDIDGSVILELGVEELKQLGITKVGERVRLLNGIKELRRKCIREKTGAGSPRGSIGSTSRIGSPGYSRTASSLNSSASQNAAGSSRPFGASTRFQSPAPPPLIPPPMLPTTYLHHGQRGEASGHGASSSARGADHSARPPNRSPYHNSAAVLPGQTPVSPDQMMFSAADSAYSSARLGSPGNGVEVRLNGGSVPMIANEGFLRQDMESTSANTPTYSSSANPSGLSTLHSRRLNAYRPPPLHLQPSAHIAYSPTSSIRQLQSKVGPRPINDGNQPASYLFATHSAGSGASGSDGSGYSSVAVTPRGVNLGAAAGTPRSGASEVQETMVNGAVPIQISASPASGTSSTLVTNVNTTVPGPQTSTSGRLRALPSSVKTSIGASPPRTGPQISRRSPSPALRKQQTTDPAAFIDRPLPGLPTMQTGDPSSGQYQTQSRPGGGGSLTRSGSYKGANPKSHTGSADLASQGHRKAGSLVFDNESPFGSGINGSESSDHNNNRQRAIGESDLHPFARSESLGGTAGSSPLLKPPLDRGYHSSDVSPIGEHGRSQDVVASYSTVARPLEPRAGSYDAGSGPQASPNHFTLDDVRRKTFKFILADDGSSRTVNLEAGDSGLDIMERVLKKFGKWRGGMSSTGLGMHSESESEAEDSTSYISVDGWGLFLERSEADDAGRPLNEAQLLHICQSPVDDAIRARGITLRRVRKAANRKDIQDFFGELPPRSSSPRSPQFVKESRSNARNPNIDKKINRASMVSVMSALGVPLSPREAQKPSVESLAPQPKSPSSASFLTSRGKKIYNFFGHRPPSELISTHLTEYFPSAKRRELERTARNSMLRLSGSKSGSRDSLGMGRPSLDSQNSSRVQSRFSLASSANSSRLSQASSLKMEPTPKATEMAIPPVPKLAVSTVTSPRRDIADSMPPSLPEFETDGESLTEQLKVFGSTERPASISSRSRISSAGSLNRQSGIDFARKLRRKSETPSMLTVDEITAEVEQRRASVILFADPKADLSAAGTPDSGSERVSFPQEENEISEEELEDSEDGYSSDENSNDEDNETEEGEEEADTDDEHGKAFTSAGSKRSIRWIKGALIGSGSFGQVFLGMDAQSGLLMAVKQVNLGASRKQDMVTAMQREIELLKDLQHDNIVQYLDSSIDQQNLNIFLEYVPGGSVAALLSNYGAFEEALVKNFVRQILTGLEYLHNRDIVHRDIKGANILVDNKGGVKISDFGISKKVETVGARNGHLSLQGSVFWMSPEAVQQKPYTKKADIWSVGCLIVEMLTGTHPFPDLSQMQAIFKIGTTGAKPSIPTDVSEDAVHFLQQSFELDQAKRPDATQLLSHAFLAR